MLLKETHGESSMSIILSNKGTFVYFLAVILVILFACGQIVVVLPMGTPTVSVQITADYCPSIEVQEGMQVAWTNRDSIDHAFILQCMSVAGSSGSHCENHRLQPGDTLSLSLMSAGQYTYYCSNNRLSTGTITVRK